MDKFTAPEALPQLDEPVEIDPELLTLVSGGDGEGGTGGSGGSGGGDGGDAPKGTW
ncbi:hypothetical protein [Pelomonas sp. SE-A7]|uniref:hypothetical protein n=1 Tax=Pelomonas sp. SE-A7 TaxID=3054953 RepID=UPI00259CB299|nr:hypothetical protein [Pelomonas sp. SE-A7]MDM4768469.1 hypothetical protein [Pelomonas sp. SE-A7]